MLGLTEVGGEEKENREWLSGWGLVHRVGSAASDRNEEN